MNVSDPQHRRVRLGLVLALGAISCASGPGSGSTNASVGGNGRSQPIEVDVTGLLKQTCDDGSGAACRKLGIRYLQHKAMSSDGTTHADLFERACDLGDPIGCVNWSIELQHRGDFAASVAPARRACELDPGENCFELARLSYLGR